jgi:hypothetical protein
LLLFLVVDRSGNTFLVDSTGVRRIDAATQIITRVVPSGIFSSPPNGIAIDTTGMLYLSDLDKSVVDRVDPATGALTVVAGIPGVSGNSGDGGPATSATLSVPAGLALDSSDNLFIVDRRSNVVRRVDAVTGVITTIVGTGTAGYSGDGGPATSAQLSLPFAIAFDTFGNLFIGEGRNKRIRRISALTGLISTIAGNGTSIWGGDGGDALQAGIGSTFALATDAKGHLFQSDPDFNRVRQILLTPQANLSLTSLAFPATPMGQTSSAQSVVLTNAGDGAMVISGIDMVQASPVNFSQTNNCGILPAPIAPGASCVLTVAFSPSAPGDESATIQIADNAKGSPHTVSLSGTGTSTTAGFTLTAPSGATASVRPGSTANFTVVLQPNLGFIGSITVSCVSAIPSAVCTVGPASISVTTTPSSPSALTITLQTTAATQSAAESGEPPTMPSLPLFVTISGLAPRATRRRKPLGKEGFRWLAGAASAGLASMWATALLLMLVISFTGCGSNRSHAISNAAPTPPGTYQLSVLATAPGGVSYSIKLTVQVI